MASEILIGDPPIDLRKLERRVMALEGTVGCGSQTSEYSVVIHNRFWSNVMMALGIIVSTGGPTLDALRQIPGVEQNHTLGIILGIVGGVTTIAGAILKAASEGRYINARTNLKIVALSGKHNGQA